VKSDGALVATANQNFIGSYRKLAPHAPEGEVWQRSGLFAFATGVPISLFNGIAVVDEVSASDLRSASAMGFRTIASYSAYAPPELPPAELG
jgi:hypothetical protein